MLFLTLDLIGLLFQILIVLIVKEALLIAQFQELKLILHIVKEVMDLLNWLEWHGQTQFVLVLQSQHVFKILNTFHSLIKLESTHQLMESLVYAKTNKWCCQVNKWLLVLYLFMHSKVQAKFNSQYFHSLWEDTQQTIFQV